jgi:hypothetical protein
MKWILVCFALLTSSLMALAQGIPAKHPRVMELEDKLTEEASLYFSRRHPSEPFFVKIEVTPLRRNFAQGANSESLPYFDQESEEMVDEWDDPTTPLSFLRNRIVRVKVSVSVPEKFDDLKISEIKQELPIYLNLLPSRDDISVERKFKHIEPETPKYVYYVLGSLLASALLIGFMFRWSISKMKAPVASTAPGPVMGASGGASSQSARPKNSNANGRTAVSGEVTFHDPIRTLEVVQNKIKQIKDSTTFPTLKDLMLMSDMCHKNARVLGSVICELPADWQKTVLWMGRDKEWFEAFSSPASIGPEGMVLLDQMSRSRAYVAGNRQWEDLMIQVWRLGDKTTNFIKTINQEHAFLILGMMPRSFSLGVAKKCFPGSWGRLLDNKPINVVMDSETISKYLNQALEIVPAFEWKMLEEYNKDKEILSYLNLISIEEERDIYETLNKESFIFSVRPPFYKVFEMEPTKFGELIQSFSLDQWALAVVNSSRQYIRAVSDQLDEKRKVIFSSHLKQFDQNPPQVTDQSVMRQQIAQHAEVHFFAHQNVSEFKTQETKDQGVNEKSA